jgi:sensor histidine kinase YesM
VTLEEEGAMLRRYLEIQHSRFPDRLSFGVDIEPAVRRAAVPTLILQPLAENALRHGIARSAGPGTVNLRAFRAGGQLCIEMFNTGRLRGGTEGIGLRNTRERLRQLYGDAHRFELREQDGGVLAAMAIPWADAPRGA